MIPYRFCFKAKAKGGFLILETIMDVFFIVDFCKSLVLNFTGMNFVTGYYKKGHVVMQRGVIIKHYLRTWFLLDLLASFPYSWVISDKKIEYWPEEHVEEPSDDFSEDFVSARMLGTLPPVFPTSSAVDFGLPALLRLLKIIRIVRLIKFFQIFKLRKLIYRVSLNS
jgi:hypothetical protein